MGELTEKIKGNANELSGNTKQAIAEMTDNERLEREGERQERKGEAQQFVGEVEGKLGNDI
ncbi:CsbD family protein [Qipengyuania gaetbuli]|uniref:CsbD family protein n=1 Tax=Qipengyuania gaetbuli TaxID=266952 RepID=A0A844Y0E6_9SPHN|nr:CsbD family protein [Qipengyuania gaetbuli]MBY6014668.1 CsbD family protein [Qipengyuania gaetbuli]MXO50917.1 CsbD family protein [Qipengyuania gaetbuli]